MMKKKYKLLLFFIVCIGFTVFARSSIFSAAAAKTDPLSLPQNILGRAYVDIQYGFSVRPPYGAQFSRVQTVPETVTQKQSPAAMEESDLLRLPESKELVRFHEEKSQTTLIVYWMVARQRNFTIEKMRTTREQHWQKFPTQATVQQSQTDTHNGLASAFVSVSWKPAKTDAVSLLIQETILQCEPSRFFMLVLTRPIQDESQRDAAEKLRSAIAKNFEYFNKTHQEQRRRAARQRAQKWLDGLRFNSVKDILEPQRWYRIRYHQKDIGYLHITEQLGTVEKKTVIQIHCDSFIASTPIADHFIFWRGYGKRPVQSDQPNQGKVGPLRLREEYQLPGDLKSEHFLVTCADPDDSQKRYREEGNWKPGSLTVIRFDDPRDEQKRFSETLKVNDKLFLPGVLDILLYRMLPLKPAEEYLFLRYANRALRFYSLRIVRRETLTVIRTDSQESNSDSEEPEGKETKIPTTYLVGRVGLDGAIVETWVDKTGRTIKLRTHDGLMLLSSDQETLQKLWAKQVSEIQK